MNRIAVALLMIVVAACGASPGPGSAGVESPATSSESVPPPSSGTAGTEEMPPAGPSDTCDIDKEATGVPTFFAVRGTTLDDGVAVAVQSGLYVNDENELFRIDVVGTFDDDGVTASAVEAYTRELRVCFDFKFSDAGGPVEGEGQEEAGDPNLPAFATESREDLQIDFAIEAILDPDEEAKLLIEALRSVDPAEWRGQLEGSTPSERQDGREDVPYIIDTVFDPRVTGYATHHYVERRASKVWAKVSSIDGTVKGGLCRGSSNTPIQNVNVKNVTPGVAVFGYLWDSRYLTYVYDLSVRGNSFGTYRVGNQSGWAGWYRGYWDASPTGSEHVCSISIP